MAKLERYLFVELVAMHCDQFSTILFLVFGLIFRIYGVEGCLDVRFVPSSCVLDRSWDSLTGKGMEPF